MGVGIVFTTTSFEVLITEIVPEPALATYRYLPSGVITMPIGFEPTFITAATLSVAVLIAVTVPGFPAVVT